MKQQSVDRQRIHAAAAVAHERTAADPLLWIALLCTGLLLAGLSIARYEGYNAAMLDLGNMAQAIWSVTQGRPLLFTQHFGQMSRLAGHAEFFYGVLALPYALWPDPRLLLTMQAVLFVLGAIPAYRLAQHHSGSTFAARCIALLYLCYPVAQTAVLFDLHGDTLAMPLLLFALDALERRAWPRYALFIALALSCKFYIALPVAGIGAYAFLWGAADQRKAGMLTAIAGLLYGVLVFFVVRSIFASSTAESAVSTGGYIDHYFGQLQEVLLSWDERLLSAVIVFAPAMLVAWRGWRWLLPGIPIAAAALISTGPGGAYDYRYHHYALVVPFIVMAVIVGSAKQAHQQQATPQRRRGRGWRGDLGLTLAIVLSFQVVLVDTPLNPRFWLAPPGQGLDASAYGITPRDAMKDRFLQAHVPPRAPLAASAFLAPHLANREVLHVVRYPFDPGGELLPTITPQVQYVLPDALFDYRVFLEGGFVAGAAYEVREIAQVLQNPAFGLVAARDGLLLFERNAAPAQVLHTPPPEIVPGAAPPSVTFGTTIGLTDSHLEPVGARRYRATFEWSVLQPPGGHYVAVSRLEGVAHSRMVHLPTYALLPTTAWEAGTGVRETFEVQLPPDLPPGRYTWVVGWYTLQHSEAYATDARSRLPTTQGDGEVVVGEIEVTS